MNVERLHAVLLAIDSDLTSHDIVANMQRLRDALNNQINSPGNPDVQRAVSEELDRLRSSLVISETNRFAPSWNQVVHELGIDGILGQVLESRIKEIFERNQITAATAADEIGSLTSQIEVLNTNLKNVLAGFGFFRVAHEQLDPGEAEISVLMPRTEVSSLEDLGKEFNRLNRMFGPFLEIATDSQEPLTVNAISSSDFGVFISVGAKTGALIAVAIERLLAAYKNLLEVRDLRNRMNDHDLPETALEGVDAFLNSSMKEQIQIIVEETLDESSANPARRNELHNALTFALGEIANRIDKGYNFDVRAEEGQTDEDGSTGTDPNIQIIINTSPNLKFINQTGESILSLPESNDEIENP